MGIMGCDSIVQGFCGFRNYHDGVFPSLCISYRVRVLYVFVCSCVAKHRKEWEEASDMYICVLTFIRARKVHLGSLEFFCIREYESI